MGTDYERLNVFWSAPGPLACRKSHSNAARCPTSGHDPPNPLVMFEVVWKPGYRSSSPYSISIVCF